MLDFLPVRFGKSPLLHIPSQYRVGAAIRLRRRSGTTATAEATTELRSELARSTTLLTLTLVTAAVLATATLAAGSTALTVVTAEHAAWGSVAALLLDVGLRNDLSGQVEPLAEVVKTLSSEGVVVPLPRELGLEVTARGQGLASLDDLCSSMLDSMRGRKWHDARCNRT